MMRYKRQAQETDLEKRKNCSMKVRKENEYKCGGFGYLAPENKKVAT